MNIFEKTFTFILTVFLLATGCTTHPKESAQSHCFVAEWKDATSNTGISVETIVQNTLGQHGIKSGGIIYTGCGYIDVEANEAENARRLLRKLASQLDPKIGSLRVVEF